MLEAVIEEVAPDFPEMAVERRTVAATRRRAPGALLLIRQSPERRPLRIPTTPGGGLPKAAADCWCGDDDPGWSAGVLEDAYGQRLVAYR